MLVVQNCRKNRAVDGGVLENSNSCVHFFFYGNVIYTILVSQECQCGIYFQDCRVYPFRSLGTYYVLCFVLLYCGDCGDCIGTTFLTTIFSLNLAISRQKHQETCLLLQLLTHYPRTLHWDQLKWDGSIAWTTTHVATFAWRHITKFPESLYSQNLCVHCRYFIPLLQPRKSSPKNRECILFKIFSKFLNFLVLVISACTSVRPKMEKDTPLTSSPRGTCAGEQSLQCP